MLEIEQILNQRYRLKRKLGQNGGRQTWQAEDILTIPHELVTVKLLAFAPHMLWDDLKLFEREANVLKHLSHPRIPEYRDYFSYNDCILWFCLVQSYVPGLSLKDHLINGRKFSEYEVKDIGISILEILVYLHELSPPVLHRDIKPSNIIIEEDGKIYLVDFGAVQARAAVEGATFTIVGTYGYTPIEQFGGRSTPASDLYALGATLIHLLTGVNPADLPQHNLRIRFHEYISSSAPLIKWVETMTNPGVEDRFQTARQAIASLNKHSTTHSSISISQPDYNSQVDYNARIRFEKNAEKLKIQILQRGTQPSDKVLILLILFLYGCSIPFGIITFPFVIAFWLVGLIPLGVLLIPALSKINLYFDQQQFTIKWFFLGLKWRSAKGDLSTITDIYCHKSGLESLNGNPLSTITIQTRQQRYDLSGVIASTSTNEQQWLIQEIKDWLDFN